MERHNIFSPFYYKGYVEETPLIQQSYTDKMIANYRVDPNHSNDWHVHSSYSGFGNLPHQLDWWESIKYYKYYINNFIQDYFGKPLEWEINDTPWYNVYGANQNGPQHEHIDSDISVVHYLKFNPEVHSGTTFINPNFIKTKYFQLSKKSFIGNLVKENINHSLYGTQFTPVVREGDLIIFPSDLEHRVIQSFSDDYRIIIAFNFTIK